MVQFVHIEFFSPVPEKELLDETKSKNTNASLKPSKNKVPDVVID